VFDNWKRTESLSAAIDTACEYHADHAERRHLFDEFTVPFDLFPAELLALFRVRQALGLPTPEVHHPVLATMLSEVPADVVRERESDWDRVLALVKEELPSLG
jgi:hypothetical protein